MQVRCGGEEGRVRGEAQRAAYERARRVDQQQVPRVVRLDGAARVVARAPQPLDHDDARDDEDERVAKVGEHLPELDQKLLHLRSARTQHALSIQPARDQPVTCA